MTNSELELRTTETKVIKPFGSSNPVFPTPTISRNSYGDISERTTVPGITKREWLAGLAMQGLLSNWEALARMGFKAHEVEKFAIERADALLKELAK